MCVFYQPEQIQPSKRGGGQEVHGVAVAPLWERHWISIERFEGIRGSRICWHFLWSK